MFSQRDRRRKEEDSGGDSTSSPKHNHSNSSSQHLLHRNVFSQIIKNNTSSTPPQQSFFSLLSNSSRERSPSQSHASFSFIILCLFILLFIGPSASSGVTPSDKREEKLINILENLQFSIQEILHTIGTPSQTRTGGRAGAPSSPTSSITKSNAGSSPPYTQRPEAGGKDYPSSSLSSGSREGKSTEDEGRGTGPAIGGPAGGNGLSPDRDTPPGGRPGSSGSGDTFTPPKKFGPGLPFRVCLQT